MTIFLLRTGCCWDNPQSVITSPSLWQLTFLPFLPWTTKSLTIINLVVWGYISKNEMPHPCLENLNHFDPEKETSFPAQVQSIWWGFLDTSPCLVSLCYEGVLIHFASRTDVDPTSTELVCFELCFTDSWPLNHIRAKDVNPTQSRLHRSNLSHSAVFTVPHSWIQSTTDLVELCVYLRNSH